MASTPENQIPAPPTGMEEYVMQSADPQGALGEQMAEGGSVPPPPAGMEEYVATALPQSSELPPPPPGMESYVADEAERARYSTDTQGALATLEGFAHGVIPGGKALEAKLFDNQADIEKRREYHPYKSYGAEAAGLVIPALLTGGASAEAKLAGEAALTAGQKIAQYTLPGLMEAAGAAGAKAIGLAAPATPLAKIGSAAVKASIENMVFQGNDEVSKMVMNNDFSAKAMETAAAHVGLAGAIGAGVGGSLSAGSQLWASKLGPKAESFLTSFKNRVNGVPTEMSQPLEQAMAKSGVTPQPALRAAMSGDHAAEEAFGILRESKNKAIVEGIEDLHSQAQKSMLDTLGKTPAELMAHDRHDLGSQAMEVLGNEIKTLHEPVEAAYEKLEAPFRNTELPKRQVIEHPSTDPYLANAPSTFETLPGFTDTMAEKLTQVAVAKDWVSPLAPQNRVFNYALESLPKLKTIEDVKQLVSNLGKNYKEDPLLRYPANELKRVLQDGMEDVLGQQISKEGPELYALYKETSANYRRLYGIRDEMAANLGLGHSGGLKDFLTRLASKRTAEETLRRLSPKNDAGLIDFLAQHFPQTLEKIRQNEVAELARHAVLRAGPEQAINTKVLADSVRQASPQMKEFMFPNGGADRILAAQDVVAALPQHKSSGTAGWLDKLNSYFPASATAAAALLFGHGPEGIAAGFILGHGAKMLARDVPDAVRLAMLKFMGSDKPVSSPAFRSMVNYIDNIYKGTSALNKASANVFKAGAEVVAPSHMPTAKERAKLEKQLKDVAQNNMELVHQDIAHYMPEHAASAAEMSMRAANYLNSLKPPTGDGAKAAPLDSAAPVSADRKAAYTNALNIAQNPLIVLAKVKQGSVTPQDMNHLKNLYPALYGQMTAQLQKDMIDHISKGEIVPYKTKQGMTLFLGQPLDSTMTPFAIQNIQAFQQGMQQQQQGQGVESLGPKQGSGGRHDMKGIAKMPQSYQTAGQAREQRMQRAK